jgi:heat shock protein HslJ
MKKLIFLLLPLAFYGCSTTPEKAAPAFNPALAKEAGRLVDATTANQQILQQYFWQLTEAKDAQGKRIDALFLKKPIELRFDNGNISIANACNRMGGAYTLAYNLLSVKPLVATKMLCQNELDQAEQAISTRIVGQQALLFSQDGDAPVITLTNAAKDKLVFKGVPTPETRFGSQAQIVFLEVAPVTKPCSYGVMRGDCLQTREIRYDAQGLKTYVSSDWQNFYGNIEGFKHDPQQRQILRLKKYRVQNPPADASDSAYILDMIIESETVSKP